MPSHHPTNLLPNATESFAGPESEQLECFLPPGPWSAAVTGTRMGNITAATSDLAEIPLLSEPAVRVCLSEDQDSKSKAWIEGSVTLRLCLMSPSAFP